MNSGGPPVGLRRELQLGSERRERSLVELETFLIDTI